MEKRIILKPDCDIRELFGNFDENIKLIENAFDVKVLSTSNGVLIKGVDEESILKTEKVINKAVDFLIKNKTIDLQKIEYIIYLTKNNDLKKIDSIDSKIIVSTFSGKLIKPRTFMQSKYANIIENNTLTFGVGPAGTGKTFLAVALAAKGYKKKEIQKIIITRPAIEAGEKLGFLPGDLQEKVDPYLRPLFDALTEILGLEMFNRLREKNIIEVAPLAYMRGRTLDNSFIILDEAQNTTKDQMKMFLTRFGVNSKVVVNGDITQIDLASGKMSGLTHAIKILKNIEDIEVVRFTKEDVVRHKLVKKIIDRYDKATF